MFEFNAIIKKDNFYISTPTIDLILTLTNIDIIEIKKISKKKYTCVLKINENNDKKKLKDIECVIQKTVLENNKKWFENNMSNLDILNKYTPFFNIQDNTLEIILHLDYLPKMDGYKNLNNFLNLSKECKNIQNVSIKLVGIYIKNNNFYIRWLMKDIEKIETVNESDIITENMFEIKYLKLEKLLDDRINNLNIQKNNLKSIYLSKNIESLSKCFYLALDKTINGTR